MTTIRVRDVGKTFRIPLDRAATLKYRVTHPRSSSRWRPFHALKGISFDVDEGEFLGIIGPNGCGKSTLLKILAGIYRADTGTVEVNGRVSPFLELGVGFNPELTARENVFLSGSVLGLTRRELADRVDSIIEFAGIEEFAETKLKNFSSGMQVRLAFSVAIQVDAQVLLMDEVLAVGDASFAEKCFDVFARYKREGKTIVLVTHDLASVHNYCDRCLLLDHGRLLADGSPADVTAQYRRAVGLQSDHTADSRGADETRGGIEISDEAGRWGSREVSISRVRMLDKDGKEHSGFTTGEPMQIEIEYTVNTTVDSFIVGLEFERTDGLNLAGPNSGVTGQIQECPPTGTRGIVRYTMERLPFLGAAYYLTVALYDRHAAYAYDHIQRLATFRVTDELGRHGLIEPAGRFEFVDDKAPDEADRASDQDGQLPAIPELIPGPSATRQG